MKIGIFTEYDEPFKGVANLTMPVLKEYCDRHGYSLNVTENPKVERSIVWDRVQVLLRNMPNFDWVVHVDADVLITNLHVPLTEFTSAEYGMITKCEREDGGRYINDGMFFVRNCDFNALILAGLWNLYGEPGILCAQDAMEERNVPWTIQPQKRFNSFLYPEYGMSELTRGNWTPGDFCLHLPGINNVRRVEILKEKQKEILR